MSAVPLGIRIWTIDGQFQAQQWDGAGRCVDNLTDARAELAAMWLRIRAACIHLGPTC